VAWESPPDRRACSVERDPWRIAGHAYLAVKLVVDLIVSALTADSPSKTLPLIVLFVLAQCAISELSTVVAMVGNVCQHLLQERVAHRIQMLTMTHAHRLDLECLEQPRFYDLVQQVERQAGFRPSAIVQAMCTLVRDGVMLISMLALLTQIDWFIACAVILAPIPTFISNAHYGWRVYHSSRSQSALVRMMVYIASILTTDSYAKEVRLFSIGPFLVDRYARIFAHYYTAIGAMLLFM
jgi:ATP-binding cassette subfamily B protein